MSWDSENDSISTDSSHDSSLNTTLHNEILSSLPQGVLTRNRYRKLMSSVITKITLLPALAQNSLIRKVEDTVKPTLKRPFEAQTPRPKTKKKKANCDDVQDAVPTSDDEPADPESFDHGDPEDTRPDYPDGVQLDYHLVHADLEDMDGTQDVVYEVDRCDMHRPSEIDLRPEESALQDNPHHHEESVFHNDHNPSHLLEPLNNQPGSPIVVSHNTTGNEISGNSVSADCEDSSTTEGEAVEESRTDALHSSYLLLGSYLNRRISLNNGESVDFILMNTPNNGGSLLPFKVTGNICHYHVAPMIPGPHPGKVVTNRADPREQYIYEVFAGSDIPKRQVKMKETGTTTNGNQFITLYFSTNELYNCSIEVRGNSIAKYTNFMKNAGTVEIRFEIDIGNIKRSVFSAELRHLRFPLQGSLFLFQNSPAKRISPNVEQFPVVDALLTKAIEFTDVLRNVVEEETRPLVLEIYGEAATSAVPGIQWRNSVTASLASLEHIFDRIPEQLTFNLMSVTMSDEQGVADRRRSMTTFFQNIRLPTDFEIVKFGPMPALPEKKLIAFQISDQNQVKELVRNMHQANFIRKVFEQNMRRYEQNILNYTFFALHRNTDDMAVCQFLTLILKQLKIKFPTKQIFIHDNRIIYLTPANVEVLPIVRLFEEEKKEALQVLNGLSRKHQNRLKRCLPSHVLDTLSVESALEDDQLQNETYLGTVEQRNGTEIANEMEVQQLVTKSNGVLWEDEYIRIEWNWHTSNNTGRLEMTYLNKTSHSFKRFAPEIVCPGVLANQLQTQAEAVELLVAAETQVQQFMNLICQKKFEKMPIMNIKLTSTDYAGAINKFLEATCMNDATRDRFNMGKIWSCF